MAANSVWKGQLTFGLVSFPVRLLKAARKERVALKYIAGVKSVPLEEFREVSLSTEETPSPEAVQEIIPVQQTYVPGGQASAVPARDLQRAFEVAPEKYVVLQPEELRRLRAATSADMQILRSVRIEEIDPVFLETSYHVVPDAGGERSYVLFYQALHESGYAALAQVAMHGREHIIIVRPAKKGLMAHTMFYTGEIRESQEYHADVTAKELALAKRFVEAIAQPFRPEEFTDRYREQLEALIAAKDVVRTGTPAPRVAQMDDGKVVDIMEALRRSLETVAASKAATASPRKPVATEPAVQPRARKRRA